MQKLTFSTLLFLFVSNGCAQTVDQLEEMINEYMAAASNYQLPTDNSKLTYTDSPIVHYYGTYDFIVVGAGTSGAVVANRLTEVKKWKVLVLEAGGLENDISDILGMAYYLYNSDFNWGYNLNNESQYICQGNTDNICSYPRGKVRGGSSTINGAVYTRGNPKDYDGWAEMGNYGWSYASILPYFKKLEKTVFAERDEEYRGVNGYLHVDVASKTPDFQTLVMEAFQELGQTVLDDYNGREQLGVARAQFTLNYNKRDSTSSAYLKRFERRSNLHVSLNSYVTKILLAGKTANGVYFIKNGKKYIAHARKEVILAGGAINSPQLLMLSGIGPKKHLREMGIPVVANLPVGNNFHDNIDYYPIVYRTGHTFYNLTLRETIVRYLENLRPLTSWIELVSFFNLNNSETERPDFEIYMSVPSTSVSGVSITYEINGTIGTSAMTIDPNTDIMFMISMLHPRSRGTVRLKSKNPTDMPVITLNCLMDPEGYDLDLLYQGAKYLMLLNSTAAFQNFGATFYHMEVPPCTADFEKYSRDWFYCSFKYLSEPSYHAVGTTSMGVSPKNSVVDPRLRVHGIKRLRVIDAGVIPEVISGHTEAPVVMIGEKGSDLIKEDYLHI